MYKQLLSKNLCTEKKPAKMAKAPKIAKGILASNESYTNKKLYLKSTSAGTELYFH